MARPGTTHQRSVLLWNGRIPMPWEVPTLRTLANHYDRCAAAPDPAIAEYYRTQSAEYHALIEQAGREPLL